MKIKDGFTLRNMAGENILVAWGDDNIHFTQLVTFNDSAALLWHTFAGQGDFSLDDMVQVLCENYAVDTGQAHEDCQRLVDSWTNIGLLE